MKTEKIKEAIKINAKLVELGIDINSKDWEIFNFKLDEWGNLIIKLGKLDHKPFVSCKNELTFEYVSELAHKKDLMLIRNMNPITEEVIFYEICEKDRYDRTFLRVKTLQEVVNYLSESK